MVDVVAPHNLLVLCHPGHMNDDDQDDDYDGNDDDDNQDDDHEVYQDVDRIQD